MAEKLRRKVVRKVRIARLIEGNARAMATARAGSEHASTQSWLCVGEWGERVGERECVCVCVCG